MSAIGMVSRFIMVEPKDSLDPLRGGSLVQRSTLYPIQRVVFPYMLSGNRVVSTEVRMRLKDKIAIVVGAGQSPGEGLGNG